MKHRWRALWIGAAILVAASTVAPPAGAKGTPPGDPAWSVDEDLLAAALECPETFRHPEREPVLLVHGTFTAGREQYGWNLLLLLPQRGFDVCVVTYPDRGLGDMQVSAEYVAHAVQTIHRRTGSKVDLMGHSQGGLLPRWAIKFWASVRAAVDDAVLVAPPSHGTTVAGVDRPPPGVGMPASFFQMRPRSQFIAALNALEEAPPGPSWTVLYTEHDVLVQPVRPVPTAALDWGSTRPDVRNILMQDVCPNRYVDHLTIGTTDRLAQELMIDAFAHPGPAHPARLDDLGAVCALPDQYVAPDQVAALVGQLPASFAGGMPAFALVGQEPPLKPYAAAFLDAAGAHADGGGAARYNQGARPAGSTPAGSTPAGPAPAGTLPATGGGGAPALGRLATALVVLLGLLGLLGSRGRR